MFSFYGFFCTGTISGRLLLETNYSNLFFPLGRQVVGYSGPLQPPDDHRGRPLQPRDQKPRTSSCNL